jgi:HD-like signal output (HDOD) protein
MDADQELQRALMEIGIPPRPDILTHLDAEARKEDPDYRKIEKLISADMGISAALIKTINSPLYGLRTKASSVHQAINLLGMSSVTRVVTGMALRNIAAGANLVEIEAFLEASAERALVTAYIARMLGTINSDHAFTFGLFQNCGILLLIARRPGYKKVLELAKRTPDRIMTHTEIDHLGISHAYIGSLMAREWGLGDAITEAIWHHHDYEEITRQHDQDAAEKPHLKETRDLIALGLLAERAVQYNPEFEKGADWVSGGRIALEHFGFFDDNFHNIAQKVQEVLSELP